MWCFPCCFKPSVSEDQVQADTQEARVLSLAIHEDELSWAIKESLRLRQQEEDEERRRIRELEKDEQIAKGLQLAEREREINNETALGDQEEDEQLQKTVLESLKDNNKSKQCEEDEQLALVVQESLNMAKDEQIAKGLQFEERERVIKNETVLEDKEEDEQLQKTVLENLKENNQRKQCEEDEELALVVQESLYMAKDEQIANGLQFEEREREIKNETVLGDQEEDEQLQKTVLESLKENNKRKHCEEDEQLALVVQESLHMAKDEKIANGLQFEEREKEIKNETVLGDQEEDEQLQKTVLESLKENNKRKHCEEDEQLALVVQESLNMVKDEQIAKGLQYQLEKDEQIARGFQYEEREREINNETALQLCNPVLESLHENNKIKQCEEQVEKDEQLALVVQESLNMAKYPTQIEETKSISPRPPSDVAKQLTKASLKEKGKRKQLEDDLVENDKQNALMIQESLNTVKSPPRHDNKERVIWKSLKGTGQRKQSKDEVEEDGKLPKVNPPSRCYICKGKIKNYGKHPYWKKLYCLAHETDGTPKCCGCERLEPKGMDYVMLDDGRRLCLECMDSAVMDSHECQHLHFEMREFFEGLNMKIDKEFPFLLVEKQALNKAGKEEKDYEYEGLIRGICLSEEQTVDSVSQRPTMGPDKKLRGMKTEAQRVDRKCEVTAILILYGLPRLLTGYILAHEMMHAYLRLKGHRNLNKLLEEGICQVVAHMWLESQTYTTVDAASSSASSSSSSGNASKKGECSDFEKELVGFFKDQIENDDTPLYGKGFKEVYEMKKKTKFNSLEETIKEILSRSRRL